MAAKDIKIVDGEGNDLSKKTDKDLIIVVVNGKKEYISPGEAEDLIRLMRGQLTLLEAEKVVRRKSGDPEYKEYIDRKTGGTTPGA